MLDLCVIFDTCFFLRSGSVTELYSRSNSTVASAIPEIESFYNIVQEFTDNKLIAKIKAYCLYYCSVPANDIAIAHYGSFNAM